MVLTMLSQILVLEKVEMLQSATLILTGFTFLLGLSANAICQYIEYIETTPEAIEE